MLMKNIYNSALIYEYVCREMIYLIKILDNIEDFFLIFINDI